MTENTTPVSAATDTALVITRTFDAPRALLFDAWTDPERMMQWWGPKGFTTTDCTIDLRPGGTIHFRMSSPDGFEIWCGGVYREIVPPERVVCTSYFSDADGNKVAPHALGFSPEWPEETLFTVTFEEREGRTTLTLRQDGAPNTPERADATKGWDESLDRLAEYVEGRE